jgi:hypothetical protein
MLSATGAPYTSPACSAGNKALQLKRGLKARPISLWIGLSALFKYTHISQRCALGWYSIAPVALDLTSTEIKIQERLVLPFAPGCLGSGLQILKMNEAARLGGLILKM